MRLILATVVVAVLTAVAFATNFNDTVARLLLVATLGLVVINVIGRVLPAGSEPEVDKTTDSGSAPTSPAG